MKAKERNLLEFIGEENKKFIVPIYQRPYSWKKENCIQLLNDLKEVYTQGYKSHFLGSVLYETRSNGVCEEHIIIDGQQRLTTVSLLLLALRDYIKEHPEQDIKVNSDEITKNYLTDRFSGDEDNLKLLLRNGDDEAYHHLVDGKSHVEDSNVTNNYEKLCEKISRMSANEIEGLYNAIARLEIVCISTHPENDDPQLIFDSLNSKGLALGSADKIRNFVLMKKTDSEQREFYEKYWMPLENAVTENKLNKLIRHYLTIKMRKLFNEKKLYFEFKNYQENSGESAETIFTDMLEYAGYFNIICNPTIIKCAYSNVLARINRLGVGACTPLIMDLFKANADGDISDDDMCSSFRIIENYIVRREICGLPVNSLYNIFVKLGEEINNVVKDYDKVTYFEAFKYTILNKTNKSNKREFPNEYDFKDKFGQYNLFNAKVSMKRYILEMLENFGEEESIGEGELFNTPDLTIEHIMPQSLSDEWKESLGDGWEEIHNKYKDTIGNLTVTEYNTEYSNLPFHEKKTMQEIGFMHNNHTLDEYVRNCDVWTDKEIVKRAELLFEKANKIWWMPEGQLEVAKEQENRSSKS